MTINELFTTLAIKEMYLRLENDEEGYYLSVIDRSHYPRVWADNFQSQQSFIAAETTDHLIERTVLVENDWLIRCTGETIDEVVEECENWLRCHNLL
jgi:hypothetical protein